MPAELRERLSPRGNIVSEAGRRRTIEVFGEPLSPQQVVERICEDVRSKGLAALADPLRLEVPDAMAQCMRAGIRVVMITGDHPQTAAAIARQARTARWA